MDSISFDKMYDVITETLQKTDLKPRWLDISRRRQKWPFAKRILKTQQKQETGGAEFRWDVKVANTNNAKHVGGYAKVSTQVGDGFVKAKAPLRASMTSWAWDTMAEEDVQRSEGRIVDVLLARRVEAWSGLIELIEDTGWSTSPASTDEETPWGLLHSILPHPSEGFSTTAGFNKMNPTTAGWSDKYGLSGATYTYWNNYTFPYADISETPTTGFLAQVFDAMDLTQFEAPYPFPNVSPDEAQWGMYTTRALRAKLNQYLKANNDNLGTDLGAYHGDPVIRGNRVEWVTNLESLTGQHDGTAITDPFIGINWAILDVVTSSEWNFKEIVTKPSDQPTVIRPTVWKKWNTINRDLSRHFFGNYFAA